MTDYIQIGKIVNTHGIRGELKVIPLTDNKERFEDLKSLYIEGEKDNFSLEKIWYKKNLVVLKLKGYDNINDVLKFKDKYIHILKKDAVKLKKDSYFIHDIIGMKVYLTNDDLIGHVVDVLQPGANDVYVIENDDKKYLIPAIKEVVKKVSIEEKKMVIDPIEGMI